MLIYGHEDTIFKTDQITLTRNICSLIIYGKDELGMCFRFIRIYVSYKCNFFPLQTGVKLNMIYPGKTNAYHANIEKKLSVRCETRNTTNERNTILVLNYWILHKTTCTINTNFTTNWIHFSHISIFMYLDTILIFFLLMAPHWRIIRLGREVADRDGHLLSLTKTNNHVLRKIRTQAP